MKKVNKFRTIKVLEEDYLKIKKWAVQRDMFDYEIVSFLTSK